MSTIGHEKIFWTTNETFSLQQPPFAQNTKYLFESNTEWPLKSCCLHSSLGFKGQRAWKSFNIPASHLSTWWTDQRLPTPSEAHNWPARESETMWRQPDATPRRAARPRSVEGWWIVRSTWRGAEAGTRGRAVSESACYTGRELKTGGFEFMGCILCGKRSWLCAWTSWNGWTNPPLRFPPLAPPRTLGPGAGNTLRRSWPAIDWGAAVFPRCEWSVLRLGRSDEGYNDKVMSSISQNSEYRFHTASFGVNASQFLFRVLFSVCEKSLCAFISG